MNRHEIAIRKLEISVEVHRLAEQYGELKAAMLALENKEAAFNRELAELLLEESEIDNSEILMHGKPTLRKHEVHCGG